MKKGEDNKPEKNDQILRKILVVFPVSSQSCLLYLGLVLNYTWTEIVTFRQCSCLNAAETLPWDSTAPRSGAVVNSQRPYWVSYSLDLGAVGILHTALINVRDKKDCDTKKLITFTSTLCPSACCSALDHIKLCMSRFISAWRLRRFERKL